MLNQLMTSLALCTLCVPGSVHAELFVVDFEDYAVNPGEENVFGGFHTVTDHGAGYGILVNSTFARHSLQNALHGADNGSTYLAMSGQGGTNVLEFVGEADLTIIDPFILVSADFAENRESFQTADRVVVTGFIDGGGTKSKEVILDGMYDGPGGEPDFQTVTFLDWKDIIHVEVQGYRGDLTIQGWFAIDNIVAESVPEPTTLLFSAMGAVGLLCYRRK